MMFHADDGLGTIPLDLFIVLSVFRKFLSITAWICADDRVVSVVRDAVPLNCRVSCECKLELSVLLVVAIPIRRFA